MVKPNWTLIAIVTVAVLLAVFTVSLSNAIRDNASKVNAVNCLSVAKLSHTPTPAEMRRVGCPVDLLPPTPAVPVAPTK